MNFLLISTIMSVEITGKNEDRVSLGVEASFERDGQNEKGLRCFGAGLEFYGSPGRIRTGDLSINSRMLYR